MKILQLSIVMTALLFAGWVLLNAPQGSQPHATLPFRVGPQTATNSDSTQTPPTSPDVVQDEPAPESVPEPPPPETIIISGKLESGDTLDSSLKRCRLEGDVRSAIIKALSGRLDFKRLDSNDSYEVVLDKQGDFLGCTYNASPLETYLVQVTPEGTTIKREAVHLHKEQVLLSGTIEGSLFGAFQKKVGDPKLIYAFADIFSSKIDFNTETRKGDRYVCLVDKYVKEDTMIGYGKIIYAAYIRTNGRAFEAYRYETPEGAHAYFNGDGEEVGTSFLRSPVPMARVTSRFTYHRRHPITGKISPHLGVDLAAPIGTPIMAAADGKVISIGRKGPNGRQIVLSHPGNYRTYYGHLSRYRKGLKRGDSVEKKEIIGYVGSSGRSTGPHLDYRIRHNGVFRNPFSLKFRPKSVLHGKTLAAFKREVVTPIGKIAASAKFPTAELLISASEVLVNDANDLNLL